MKRDRETVTEYIIMAGSANHMAQHKQFTDGLQFVVNFLPKVELGKHIKLGNFSRLYDTKLGIFPYPLSHYLLLAC